MKFLKLAVPLLCVLAFAGSAEAAEWTTVEGGSEVTQVCQTVKPGGTCYVQTNSETSAVIEMAQCQSWQVTVFDTATSVMPQACSDRACTSSVNLLSTGLTGTTPNIFANSQVPINYMRLVTADDVTVSLRCGK